jgi:hypothetical protein
MTTATRRHRRLAPITRLGVALIGTCLLPAAAGAAGFSGSFDPANWSIVNTTDGSVDQTLNSSGSPPVTSAAYYCGNSNQVACVQNVDATNGAVQVVGSISGVDGGGTANTARTTTWTVTNGAQPSTLMFTWAFATTLPLATNQSAWYLVGTNATPLTANDGDSGSVSSITLAPFETFGFRVSTTDNIADFGVLSITNFTATPTAASEVPAPLPLAGAAATFHWSRRLRRRRLALRP